MAKTSAIQKNLKRIKLSKKYEKKRMELKKIIKNKKLELETVVKFLEDLMAFIENLKYQELL
jgi:small subunit ribosomal protein S14